MSNPYNELYQLMGQATVIQPSFFIAKVKTGFPNLEVSLDDIILSKEDLLVDKWIVDRNKNLSTESTDHSHGIKEPIQDILTPGDSVILLRIGDKFIVLSKVVSI